MSSKDKPKTAKDELRIYTEAQKKETTMEVGQIFYVISAKWYRQWKDYVNHNEDDETPNERPDCIDNSDIIERTKCDDGEVQVKTGLQERYDYELISEAQWELLHSWYGGGPAIRRKVISENDGKIKRVEVNLLYLEVLLTDKDGSPNEKTLKRINVSKTTKIGELKALLAKLFDVDITQIRIWNYESPSSATLLNDTNSTLAEEQIIYGQKLLVEKQLKDGTWPRAAKNIENKEKKKGNVKGVLSGGSKEREDINSTLSIQKGCCGLVNLGNTCFMNSALQCLSNTPFLNEYFVEGRYKDEINTKNPLGMKGAIADVFGMLLKSMWSGEFESIAPKKFKHVLGKWAPQFEGFSQHDSQEFLGALLDGLHEDLNRVLEKQYVELKESDGRPDDEVAKEAWENHLRRNRSVIVDLFQGQLKSTVKCPDCGKVSITFDPFMYLSLPLVQEHEIWLEIAFFRDNDTATPTKYAVKVRKNGQIFEVKEALSKLTGVEPERIALTYLQQLRLMPFYKNSQSIATISPDATLVAYEISKNNHPDLVHAKIIQRRKRMRAPLVAYHEVFGITLMVFFVPQETTGRQLYRLVWDRCKRFIRRLRANSEESMSDSTKHSKHSRHSHDHKDAHTKSTSSTSDSDARHHHDQNHHHRHQGDGNDDNNNNTPSPNTSKDHVNESNNIVSEDTVNSNNKPKNDIELDFNRLPFKLSLVAPGGLNCGICGSDCTGCALKPDDNPIVLPRKDKSITLAIDWEQKILDDFYDEDEAMSVTIHKTVTEKRANQGKQPSITLDDCLNLFTTQERLGPEDPWYCPKCKDHKQAFKKIELWKLPTILIIHLKRFQYTRYLREKLTFFVDFPIENLDLSKFVINPDEKSVKYDLFAVSNHMGGLGGGHYIACCKNKDNGQWNIFNDHSVTPVTDPNKIKTNYAYVLFYKKKGIKTYLTPSERDKADTSKKDYENQTKMAPTSTTLNNNSNSKNESPIRVKDKDKNKDKGKDKDKNKHKDKNKNKDKKKDKKDKGKDKSKKDKTKGTKENDTR